MRPDSAQPQNADARPSPVLPRVAIGDAAALQECIDRYSGLIWSLARRFLSRQPDAEDAVQEVYIALWKNAARFDAEIASEPTFVAMIARRRLIDRRRRLSRDPESTSATAVDDLNLPAIDESDDRLEIEEEAGIAADAMRALRPQQQRVLRLSIHEGWSHQQIAEHMNLPLGTVKTHARRGLLRVRELLQQRRAADEHEGFQ